MFGLGANFSNTKDNILKYLGMNLLLAVFISEGLDKIFHFSEYKHMIIGVLLSIIIGIVLYFAINNKELFKKKNLLSIICLVILGIAGFDLLFAV